MLNRLIGRAGPFGATALAVALFAWVGSGDAMDRAQAWLAAPGRGDGGAAHAADAAGAGRRWKDRHGYDDLDPNLYLDTLTPEGRESLADFVGPPRPASPPGEVAAAIRAAAGR